MEGGGKRNNKYASIKFRNGFSDFIKKPFGSKGNRIRVIACGNRESTFGDFQKALQDHPDSLKLLLIDSDGPVVAAEPRQYLQDQNQGRWNLRNIADEQCHLMVQMMEAWLIADIEALKRFYKKDFNSNPIPKNPNVEEIEKNMLSSALKDATRRTTKGEYHKIHHGSEILKLLDVSKVRRAAYHCNRLFNTLAEKIDAQI